MKFSNEFKQRNPIIKKDMSKYTTFKIGGVVDFINMNDENDMVSIREDIPLIGGGANLLVADNLEEKYIASLSDKYKELNLNDFHIGAAVSLNTLINKTINAGYKGLEQLSGIPGSVGGAIYMNAGGKDNGFLDRVKKIRAILPDRNKADWYDNKDFLSSYRKSGFPEKTIFLECILDLEIADSNKLKEEAKQQRALKASVQPIEKPSAGCVFKNSELISAGRLIDSLGFKGYSINDAMVSDKHANFIINKGKARAEDVLQLIDEIQKKAVKERNINLELEVQLVHL